MYEETTKHHWLRLAAIAIITFIGAFLAFYIVMEIMYNRLSEPNFETKRFERLVQQEQNYIRKYDEKMMESPFEPRMRPMIVNLVKENNEYKIIVDLKMLESNENNIKVNSEGNILTVSGEVDKKQFGNERIINFAQSYYLNENLDLEKMTKEKKGYKYIITIPFED